MSNTAECIPNERALRMGCTTIGKQLMRKSISLFSQFEFMHESGGDEGERITENEIGSVCRCVCVCRDACTSYYNHYKKTF